MMCNICPKVTGKGTYNNCGDCGEDSIAVLVAECIGQATGDYWGYKYGPRTYQYLGLSDAEVDAWHDRLSAYGL